MQKQTSSAESRAYGAATLMIGVPAIALLAVPFYSHVDPVVLDFPMFYWWTFLWIAALSLGILASYRIIERAKAGA